MSGAPRLQQTRNAECGVGTKLHGIAEVVVQAANDGMHATESGQRLEVDAILTRHEVAALGEREAQIAREVGVFEVGLVVRARREQHDVRRFGAARRGRDEGFLKRPEETREQLDPLFAEGVGEQPRDDEAILQRVAGARRRLHPRADHAPSPIGAPPEIEGHQVEKRALRRPDAVTRAQKPRMRQDERCRHEAFHQQPLRSVEIGGNRVQQSGALAQAAGQQFPVVGGDDERQHVEAPGAGRTIGGCVDVVGDAVLEDLPLDPILRFGEPSCGDLARVSSKRLPVRLGQAARAQQLVEVLRRDVVGREERAQAVGVGLQCHVRRSSVYGNSRVRSDAPTAKSPGVWPILKNRPSRRLSAS